MKESYETQLRATPQIQELINLPAWLVDGGMVFGTFWCTAGIITLLFYVSWYGTGSIGLGGAWLETEGVYLYRTNAGDRASNSGYDIFIYHFAYEVDGKRYEELCYGKDLGYYNYSLKPQKPVTVLYCASDPAQGCLPDMQVAKYNYPMIAGWIMLLLGSIVVIGSLIKNTRQWQELKEMHVTVAKLGHIEQVPPSQNYRGTAYRHYYNYQAIGRFYQSTELMSYPKDKTLPRLMLFDAYQPQMATMLGRVGGLKRKIRYLPSKGMDTYRIRSLFYVVLLAVQVGLLLHFSITLLW